MPKGAPIMFSKFSFISRNINVHIVIKQMKVYVYIDESGSIHKNSKTRYFAVGGYFTFFEGKNKKKKKDERKLLYGEPELEKRRRGW